MLLPGLLCPLIVVRVTPGLILSSSFVSAIVDFLPSANRRSLDDDVAIIEFLVDARPDPLPIEFIMLLGKPDMLCLVALRLESGVYYILGFPVAFGDSALVKAMLSSTSMPNFAFDFTPMRAFFKVSVMSLAEPRGLSPCAYDL